MTAKGSPAYSGKHEGHVFCVAHFLYETANKDPERPSRKVTKWLVDKLEAEGSDYGLKTLTHKSWGLCVFLHRKHFYTEKEEEEDKDKQWWMRRLP